MIIENIRYAKKFYAMNKDFEAVFEILKNLSENSDKTVVRDGEVWVNAPAVTQTAIKPFEAHRKFIDIHYVVSGSEVFGYSDIKKLTVTKEYDSTTDCEFLEGDAKEIVLNEGDFLIAFPEDAHIPSMRSAGGTLIRTVAKIKL